MSFDPKPYLMKVQGNRLYLPVAARLIWFRDKYPDWSIETTPLTIDMEKQYAIFQATIRNEMGRVMGMGTKFENKQGFGDFIEKAESGAIGRACSTIGIGTQFEGDSDGDGGAEMAADRPVDSPQPARNRNGNGSHPAAHPTRNVIQPRPFPTEESLTPHSLKQEIILALGYLGDTDRKTVLGQMNEQYGHRNVNAATDGQLQWVGARIEDVRRSRELVEGAASA